MAIQDPEAIRESMKKGAAALRDASIPFALGGGLATWARGAPGVVHDVDFMVRPNDADTALKALAEAGMRTEHPPEGWLYKAYDGDVMIDVIFRPVGRDVDDDLLGRAEEMEVDAVFMKVMSVDDVMVTKLLALSEQDLDYARVLEIARALREQIDWEAVRQRTDDSPYAAAFFTLAEGLGVIGERRDEPHRDRRSG